MNGSREGNSQPEAGLLLLKDAGASRRSSQRTISSPSWKSGQTPYPTPSSSSPAEDRIYRPMSAVISKAPDLALAKLRFEPGKLYGRDEEIQMLKNQLPHADEKPVIIINGMSGVGKSALVSTLAKATRKGGGMYVLGKYDFQPGSRPYSAITEACRWICEHLLQEKPSKEQIKELRRALGSSTGILSKVIPDLLELVGTDNLDADDVLEAQQSQQHQRVNEAQNRFLFAMGCFLRVVASWKPLVMVLDDLQWADDESVHLLDSLVNESQLRGLILVGCYRDNEVQESHPLAHWINDLRTRVDIRLTCISLTNLSVGALNQMLAGILNMEPEETSGLATAVHKKTMGNAFFVKEYLKLLSERRILCFSLGLMKWTWNVEEIVSETDATDNVVGLMQAKMESLPNQVCEMLPLAACLGWTFSARVLSIVVDAFQQERGYLEKTRDKREVSITTLDWLEFCESEGFLEGDQSSETFCWVHDKIQAAALAMVVPDKLKGIQYFVGKVLHERLAETEFKEHIFVVANLINQGLCSQSVEKGFHLEIARLNLDAGHAAMTAASFANATAYLQIGISRLPENHWNLEYEISLALFCSAAEAAYGKGDMAQMEEYCNAVIERKEIPVTDKLRVYNVLIPSIGSRNLVRQAFDKSESVLRELGCTFPARARFLHTIGGVLRLKSAQRKYRPRDFELHEEMTEGTRIQVMSLLDKFAEYAYLAKSSVLPLAIMKSYHLTLRYGLSEWSPPAFAAIGFIFCVKLEDFQAGKSYADCAMTMIKTKARFGAVASRTTFLAYTFALHHTAPMDQCLKGILEGYNLGMCTGDVTNAFWNAIVYLDYSFFLGKNLVALNHDYIIYAKQMKSYNQLQQLILSQLAWQVLQNLLGLSSDPLVLNGTVVNLDCVKEEQLYYLHVRQVELAAWMCDDVNGAGVADKLKKDIAADDFAGTFNANSLEVFTALLSYGAARKTSSRIYLSAARKAHRLVKKFGRQGNPNFVHAEPLLDAELAALKKQRQTAKKCYEESIRRAARRGFINFQALACERYADYMHECGNNEEAKYRWNQAILLFTEWGAVAKVKQVREKLDRLTPC